jgi:short-subunit dehydrogenase
MKTSRVFLTGASSGLGEALALHHARPGASVGLVARRRELLETLAESIAARGARAHVYAGDVRDTAFMAESARRFVAEAGGVDLVVANAGIAIADDTRGGDASRIASLMQVNVIGVTNTVIPFVPAMLTQGHGVLAAVASFAGHLALPGRSAYSASKAAVITFMDGLRMDLHGTGVHAMTLCPGFVATPLTQGIRGGVFMISTDEAVAEMSSAIEARRGTFTFPWQVRLLSRVAPFAPESLVRRLAPPPRTTSSS